MWNHPPRQRVAPGKDGRVFPQRTAFVSTETFAELVSLCCVDIPITIASTTGTITYMLLIIIHR